MFPKFEEDKKMKYGMKKINQNIIIIQKINVKKNLQKDLEIGIVNIVII